MLVKDVMTPSPLHVSTDTSMVSVVTLMAEHHQSCLIVTDNHKPVGIITERDLTLSFAQLLSKQTQQSSLPEHVSSVMTPNPLCIPETMPLNEALTLSRSRKLRHLPIVNDDGILEGLVTQNILLDAFAKLAEENSELEQSIEALRLLSLEDPLMRIGNRRAMEVDLNFTQAEHKRHGKPYSIALLDIDFFKRYNDCYGHQAGDVALCETAKLIKAELRSADRVYRYGGEEFLVLMPETDLDSARQALERMRTMLEEKKIKHEGSFYHVLTFSAGISDGPNDDWKVMVNQADSALYRAKDSGRNRVTIQK